MKKQKETAMQRDYRAWWMGDCMLSPTATRFVVFVGLILACSFAYVLLLIFTSNSCILSHDTDRDRGLSLQKKMEVVMWENEINDGIYVDESGDRERSTSLGRIVFGIAATARLWERRKNYVKLWWRPNEMRGFVWLDTAVPSWSSALPPFRVSANTSQFHYTRKGGRKAAIRLSRIVSETFRVGLQSVDWFVMGDDDTVFVAENLVKLLSKYDHTKYYYIGSSSESHNQNLIFSYNMAYGGGGFAISYPLAKALEQNHEQCLERYPFLYGSDDRIHACMAELGVPLTKEPGFHQLDVYGDVSGLLSAHPIAPLISMHHLDVINPLFPKMTRVKSLQHLWKAVEIDPAGILQQSMCYEKRRRWSVSVSWGYMIKVSRGIITARELEIPSRSFMSWDRKYEDGSYSFSTRPSPKERCQKPIVFHRTQVRFGGRRDGISESNYSRSTTSSKHCKKKSNDSKSPDDLDWIYVHKTEAPDNWFQAPRRQCCEILEVSSKNMQLQVRECKQGETIS